MESALPCRLTACAPACSGRPARQSCQHCYGGSFMQTDSYERLSATPAFANWSRGYGVISHTEATQKRVAALAARLVARGSVPDHAFVFDMLAATDRLTSAAMWLV